MLIDEINTNELEQMYGKYICRETLSKKIQRGEIKGYKKAGYNGYHFKKNEVEKIFSIIKSYERK